LGGGEGGGQEEVNFIHLTRLQSMTLIQWKMLIIITLGSALFDNNNRLITLSGGYKNLHYLTQFIVTTFYMHKKRTKFI
jgi:hypothetical protein